MDLGEIFQLITLSLLALGAIIHIALAISVFSDASQRGVEKKPVVFLGPTLWGLTCLCTGLFGLLAYWLIHHSALRRLYEKDEHHGHGHGHH